ncbi:MAG: TonB-dependent receptor, partial [Saprospiraceae bacterium]|nr:TonB-dependent receptor [Saprospiraceae bacterium]
YTLSPSVEVSGGIRLVNYRFLGPGEVPRYNDPERPDEDEITEIASFTSGETIATYNSFEPRFSLRYRLNPTTSLKTGYSRTAQFINQIFNADSPTPGNQYQLSTEYLSPNRAHNVSVGIFKNFEENEWETSLEVYGRSIDQLYDFKDFAQLRANNNLETETLEGIGRAYGIELSIKKNRGKYNGMINYTYSRTERQIDGINEGAWYPSSFDLPHNVAAVLNYQPNQRHTITLNFNYHRGRPVTAPVGTYATLDGLLVPLYSSRNGLRIPDYHRLDFAYTIGQGYRKDRRFKTSWTLSVYNVYGRRNPFTVFYDQEITQPGRARQLAVLGSAFPAITFNFEWK